MDIRSLLLRLGKLAGEALVRVISPWGRISER